MREGREGIRMVRYIPISVLESSSTPVFSLLNPTQIYWFSRNLKVNRRHSLASFKPRCSGLLLLSWRSSPSRALLKTCCVSHAPSWSSTESTRSSIRDRRTRLTCIRSLEATLSISPWIPSHIISSRSLPARRARSKRISPTTGPP